MLTRLLVILLAVSLLVAHSPAQTKPQSAPSMKERVLLLAAGSVVEVKLKDKRKLVGRMGAVTDDYFVLQHAKNDKMLEEKLEFGNVRSIKSREQGMSTAAKVALGAAAGAGALIIVLLIISYSI